MKLLMTDFGDLKGFIIQLKDRTVERFLHEVFTISRYLYRPSLCVLRRAFKLVDSCKFFSIQI